MTDSPLADELGLRFTEREVPLSPPDVAAFSGVDRALLREQLAQHDDHAPLADLIGAGLLASHTRIVLDSDSALASAPVFVTLRSAPIPAIDVPDPTGLDAPCPVDPAPFALADRVDGHLAWLSTERPRSRPAAALLLAVAIPLAIPDVAAAQSPAAPAATTAAVPEPPPAATPAPAPTAASAETLPAPAVRPQGPTPLSPERTLQAILEAMKGQEAILFARGGTITGRVIGFDGDFVIMIDYEHDGKIAMIPKSDVLDVRGKIKKAPPADMPDGTGALAGGGVLVALGSPLMLSGLVFLGIIPSSGVVYLPQVIPAAVLLGAGIPLLVRGTRQRRAYRAAHAGIASRISPSFGPARGGWTGGLTLRF